MNAQLEDFAAPAFGASFAPSMAICWFREGAWTEHEVQPTQPLSLHPGAHVLHYASSCFEGLKAFRSSAGDVRIFRLDRHVDRMRRSAGQLCLPVPERERLDAMIRNVTAACRDQVPDFPGALYLRPTLIGTQANIGAAAAASREACLYVLASPVGDYFGGGQRPLKLAIDEGLRTTPAFGMTKSGVNYALALGRVLEAKERFGADQVLFCPEGDVQETAASNFLLINDGVVLTKPLDTSYLHGVTRDSLLELAPTLGYRVEERSFLVEELLEWVRTGEAALSGTAAVLASVGSVVHRGHEFVVRNGQVGPNTQRLRQALLDIQSGEADDAFGWLTPV